MSEYIWIGHMQVIISVSSSHVQSLRSSVNEVIEAIDTQLSKQDDIKKKKVSHSDET